MHIEFSLPRFWQTLRYTWQTQPLLPYMIMVGLLPFGYILLGEYFNEDAPWAFFTVILFVCGFLYAGLSFKELNHPVTARQYLGLPASIAEKWMAKWLLAFVVFPLIAILFFQLSMLVFNTISLRLWTMRYLPPRWSCDAAHLVFFFFILIQPLAFVSGLLWTRFSVFKTLLAILVIGFILILIAARIEQPYNDANQTMSLLSANVVPVLPVNLPDELRGYIQQFWLFGAYLPAFLLLIASYLLLKNKEV